MSENGDEVEDSARGHDSAAEASGRGRTRKISILVAAVVLGLSAVGYAATRGLIWPRRTDRMNEPFSDYGGGTYGTKVARGDERIFLDFFQHEPAEDVITIEHITPGEAQGPVEVVDIAIAIRRPGEPFLVSSMYPVAPTTPWRECDAQLIADPTGYKVEPGELVMLVEKLRFTGPGPGELESAEITFRRNGVRFRSQPGMHLEFEVHERFGQEHVEDSWESACRQPTGVLAP